jgi:plasmid stability protein
VDFTIRNLPAPVLEDLQRAARLNGRSVNDEVVARLATASPPSAPDIAAELAEIDRLRASLSVPRLTQDYLQSAVDEGRP